MQDDTLFWQTRIRISQAPEPFNPQPTPETTIPFYQKHEDFRSFLNDPFGENPPTSYGLELSANEKVEVVFFTKAESRAKAMSSISKEEVKKGLTYSIAAIVVTFLFSLLGLNYPFPTSTGIYILMFSLTFMTVGIVSLIIYFVNPEISYGMWISRKKSKNLDNRNVLVGRRILLVIMTIGLCVSLFVFIIIINAILS